MKKLIILSLAVVAIIATFVPVSYGVYRENTIVLAAGDLSGSYTNTRSTVQLQVQDIYGLSSVATQAAHTVTVTKGGIVRDSASVAVSNSTLRVDCDGLIILNKDNILTINRPVTVTNSTLTVVIVSDVIKL